MNWPALRRVLATMTKSNVLKRYTGQAKDTREISSFQIFIFDIGCPDCILVSSIPTFSRITTHQKLGNQFRNLLNSLLPKILCLPQIQIDTSNWRRLQNPGRGNCQRDTANSDNRSMSSRWWQPTNLMRQYMSWKITT